MGSAVLHLFRREYGDRTDDYTAAIRSCAVVFVDRPPSQLPNQLRNDEKPVILPGRRNLRTCLNSPSAIGRVLDFEELRRRAETAGIPHASRVRHAQQNGTPMCPFDETDTHEFPVMVPGSDLVVARDDLSYVLEWQTFLRDRVVSDSRDCPLESESVDTGDVEAVDGGPTVEASPTQAETPVRLAISMYRGTVSRSPGHPRSESGVNGRDRRCGRRRQGHTVPRVRQPR
jgi:hypothetical protein